MAFDLKALYRRQILVARVYGIPVRIDYRWFVVFALSVLLIASNLHQHALQLGKLCDSRQQGGNRLGPGRNHHARAFPFGVRTRTIACLDGTRRRN